MKCLKVPSIGLEEKGVVYGTINYPIGVHDRCCTSVAIEQVLLLVDTIRFCFSLQVLHEALQKLV